MFLDYSLSNLGWMLVTDEKFEIESTQSDFSCHSHLGSGVLNLEVSLINHWVHRKQALVESAHLSGLNWNSKKNTFKKTSARHGCHTSVCPALECLEQGLESNNTLWVTRWDLSQGQRRQGCLQQEPLLSRWKEGVCKSPFPKFRTTLHSPSGAPLPF